MVTCWSGSGAALPTASGCPEGSLHGGPRPETPRRAACVRRMLFGGELGGPQKPKLLTAGGRRVLPVPAGGTGSPARGVFPPRGGCRRVNSSGLQGSSNGTSGEHVDRWAPRAMRWI